MLIDEAVRRSRMLQSCNITRLAIYDPHVIAIERKRNWLPAHAKDTHCSTHCVEFRHGIAGKVGNPNVETVKCDSLRSQADAEGADGIAHEIKF